MIWQLCLCRHPTACCLSAASFPYSRMAGPTAFSCRNFADSVGFDVSMHVGCLQNRSSTMLVKNQSLPRPRFCLRELRGTWTELLRFFFYLVRSLSEGATSAAHVTQHCCASVVVQRQALYHKVICPLTKFMCVEPVASCVDVVEQFAWGLEVVMWCSSSNSARIRPLKLLSHFSGRHFLDLTLKAPWGPLSMITSAPHVRHHFRSTRRHFGPCPPNIAHHNGTLRRHPAMAARPLPQSWSSPYPNIARHNGTQQWQHVHSLKIITLPPKHSTPQWHPTLAPSNGSTSAPPKLVVRHPTRHPTTAARPIPQTWSSLPPKHSTQQWHPTMAPSNRSTPLPQP